ncbi:MAG TPA: polysaccharide deacetylase family protein [Candidatus Cybelea sp.]|nr:polysaccharide deacetylase family protein [Candidatus Cybelea sp.]
MLEVAQGPVALAVIPDRLLPDLALKLPSRTGFSVLQHGFAHVNRAEPGRRKSEFPDSRDPAEIRAELAAGRRRLEAAFGPRFLPVLTPPWNRIGGATLAFLSELGFRGVSQYQPRPEAWVHGVKRVNTHVDVIDWQGGRGFLGESACLDLLIGHLRARRAGLADADEPTGLLTHHLVHDPATWRFCEKLRSFLGKQAATHQLDPAEAFA